MIYHRKGKHVPQGVRERDLERDQGEVVWVQGEEADSKEWFECIVASKKQDPLPAGATVYRLVMRDTSRPFADGRYLPSRRLYDFPNRRRAVFKWISGPEDDVELKTRSGSSQHTGGTERRLDATPATTTVRSASCDNKPHSDDDLLRGRRNSLWEDESEASASRDIKTFAAEAKPHPEASSGFYDTGPAFSYVKDEVTRVMAEQPEGIELDLAWDVIAILHGQHASGKIAPGCLSKTIVYNGTPTMCYATTVRQYAEMLWPAVCSPVLECIEWALSSPGEEFSPSRMNSARFHGTIMTVGLDGATTNVIIQRDLNVATYPHATMSQVAELFVWLATACRDHPDMRTVGLSSTTLTVQTNLNDWKGISIGPNVISAQGENDMTGQCWFGMVCNPVIAVGYPIPERDDVSQDKGLEVSLDLMVAMSRADFPTIFGDAFILKGVVSALVATARSEDAIMWHFMINTDKTPMTYQQVSKHAAAIEGLLDVDLEAQRHFVGLWATDASVLAGTNVPGLYDIGETTNKEADHYVLTWDRLTFGGGQYATLAASFSLGRKDCSVDFPTDVGWAYETCIELARKNTMLFYSSVDQRGWLLDGATALVHLARASLTVDWIGKRHEEVLDKLHYIRHHEDGISAKEALLLNADIEIFTKSEPRKETTTGTKAPMLDMTAAAADALSVSGPAKEPQSRTEYKKVEEPWTYGDLVLKLWQKLERLQADSQTPRSLQIKFHSTAARLTGWETEHLITHKRRVAHRYVKMGSESKSWRRYVKKLSPVVLLAPNFGDLVSAFPGALVCEKTQQIPTNRGLLVAPICVLRLSAKRWQDGKSVHPPGCVRINESTFLWAYDPSAAGFASCSQVTCAPISTLQDEPGRHQMSFGDEDFDIFVRYPNGVIVFGVPDTHNHPKQAGKTPRILGSRVLAADRAPGQKPSCY